MDEETLAALQSMTPEDQAAWWADFSAFGTAFMVQEGDRYVYVPPSEMFEQPDRDKR